MTKHLPYVEWITSDDTLPTNYARELRAHVEQCAECRSIYQGWEVARQMIRAAGMESPSAGFAGRWKAMAQKRLRAPNPRQAWVFLAATGLGSLAMAASLAAQTASRGFSLAGTFARSITTTTGTLSDFFETAQVLGMISNAISRSTPTALWLAAIFVLCLLCVVWLIFLYRFSRQGVKS